MFDMLQHMAFAKQGDGQMEEEKIEEMGDIVCDFLDKKV